MADYYNVTNSWWDNTGCLRLELYHGEKSAEAVLECDGDDGFSLRRVESDQEEFFEAQFDSVKSFALEYVYENLRSLP